MDRCLQCRFYLPNRIGGTNEWGKCIKISDNQNDSCSISDEMDYERKDGFLFEIKGADFWCRLFKKRNEDL